MFDYTVRSRRSPWPGAMSLFAHVSAVALLTSLTYGQVAAPPVSSNRSIRYISLAAPLPPPLPAPAPKPRPRTTPVAPAPAPRPLTPAPAPVAVAAVPRPIAPAPAPVRVEPPPRAPEPTVEKPAVVVGLFKDTPSASAVAPRPQAPVSTGFDRPRAATPAAPAAGPVGAAGFGDRRSAPVTQPQRDRGAVAPSGFDVAAAAPAARQQAPAPAVTTPVEVLFKPTPKYTDEARAGRVQGEVVLHVEFGASGRVRVLRVVRGLGHGLDEMAARAAEQIKFKPATEDGRPVDFRANVQIVFRLT